MPAMPCPDAATALLDLAGAARRVLLTGPRDVDGDSLGSCLALARALRERCAAEVVVAGEPGWRYAGLPGADACVPNAQVGGAFDLAVVLDGDRRRLDPRLVPFFDAAASTVVIDHHESTTGHGHCLALVDRGATATAEIVWALLETWGVALDADLARLLYTGIVYDTGGLRHSNTTPATLRLAARFVEAGADHNRVVVRTTCERRPEGLHALGHVLTDARMYAENRVAVGTVPRALFDQLAAGPGDLDFLVDQLLYVVGVEVAILAVERPGPSGPEVKLSLRSRGLVDVCAVARHLHDSGGGHKRAAGVVLTGDLEALLAARVVPEVVAALALVGGATP